MKYKLLLLAALLLLLLLVVTSAYAQGTLDLSWWTVDDGGAIDLSSDEYSLSGTIGQSDATVLSNGEFSLNGGFWMGAPPIGSKVYLPLVAK